MTWRRKQWDASSFPMWSDLRNRVEKDLSQFLHFTGLAGAGWLLDFALLQVFATVLHFPIALGNIFSSCIASLFVFTLSRRVIFNKASGNVFSRFAFYSLYTLAVILAASLLAAYVQAAIEAICRAWNVEFSKGLIVAATKIAITPPQLLLNYFVSKFLIETSWRVRNGDPH